MFYINAFQHVTPSLGEGCPNAVTKLRKKRHLQTCRALIGHHSIERPVSLSTPHVVRQGAPSFATMFPVPLWLYLPPSSCASAFVSCSSASTLSPLTYTSFCSNSLRLSCIVPSSFHSWLSLLDCDHRCASGRLSEECLAAHSTPIRVVSRSALRSCWRPS